MLSTKPFNAIIYEFLLLSNELIWKIKDIVIHDEQLTLTYELCQKIH